MGAQLRPSPTWPPDEDRRMGVVPRPLHEDAPAAPPGPSRIGHADDRRPHARGTTPSSRTATRWTSLAPVRRGLHQLVRRPKVGWVDRTEIPCRVSVSGPASVGGHPGAALEPPRARCGSSETSPALTDDLWETSNESARTLPDRERRRRRWLSVARSRTRPGPEGDKQVDQSSQREAVPRVARATGIPASAKIPGRSAVMRVPRPGAGLRLSRGAAAGRTRSRSRPGRYRRRSPRRRAPSSEPRCWAVAVRVARTRAREAWACFTVFASASETMK